MNRRSKDARKWSIVAANVFLATSAWCIGSTEAAANQMRSQLLPSTMAKQVMSDNNNSSIQVVAGCYGDGTCYDNYYNYYNYSDYYNYSNN